MIKLTYFAEDVESSLFPVYIFGKMLNEKLQDEIGETLTYWVHPCFGDSWKCAIHEPEWKRLSEKMFKKFMENKRFKYENVDKIFKKCDELIDFSEYVSGLDLKELSSEEIADLLQEYERRLIAMYFPAGLQVVMDFHYTPLSDAIEKMFRRKSKKPTEDMSILTTPLKESFIKKHERELLELVSRIKKDNKAVEMFKSEMDLNKFPYLKHQIRSHVKEHGWNPCCWEGDSWDETYITELIASMIKQDMDVDAELEKQKKEWHELREKQDQLEKELDFNEEEKYLLELAREVPFIKGYRKDLIYRSLFLIRNIINEISKRFDLSLKEVRSMLFEEIYDLLRHNKIDRDAIKQRTKLCVYAIINGEEKGILHGKEAEEIISLVKEEKIDEDITEIKGQCACSGKAKGTVKIVKTPKDMGNFNEGDILVSHATNPNLVPAMEKASAIITDEGGLTCHAAIVSRELGVPCIIGTFFATKALKPGMEIEVDADAGLIKILGKQEEQKTKYVQVSTRSRLSPFPNIYSMEAVNTIMKNSFGYSQDDILMVWENNTMYVYMNQEERKKAGEEALEICKRNPRIMHENTAKVEKIGPLFLEFCKEFYESDLTKKSKQELFELYKEYVKKYKEIYSSYFGIITLEKPLSEILKKYLKERVSEKSAEYFSYLVMNKKAVYAKDEELELNKIAKKIKDDNLKIEHPEIDKLLNRHTEKFFWLTRDYEDPVLEKKDFIEKLKKIENPEETIEEIEKGRINAVEKIKEIEKEIDIDDYYKDMAELIREGSYLKELRKRFVSESFCYVDKLLEEIGKRINLTLKEVRFLKQDEIENALLYDIEYNNLTEERIENLSVYVIQKGITTIYTGESAKEFAKDFYKTDFNDIKEVKGDTASAGKVIGPVKLIPELSELDNVKEGDVIVTVQALPIFIKALYKAKGLVSEGIGGVTSHASTLAREVGIPCITGASMATKVFKDGDIIELDASNGIAKLAEEDSNDIFFNMEEIKNVKLHLLYDINKFYTSNIWQRWGLKNKIKEVFFPTQNNTAQLIMHNASFKKLGEEIFQNTLKNPQWLKSIQKEIRNTTKKYINYCRTFLDLDLSKLSDEELVDLYEKAREYKNKQHFPGQPEVILEFKYNHFSKYLLDYIRKKKKEKDLNLNENEVFRILSVPYDLTFSQQEEDDMLDIAEHAIKNKKVSEILKKYSTNDIFDEIKKESPFIANLIDDHFNKYRWLSYFYMGPGFSKEYFIEILALLVKKGDIKELRKQKENSAEEIKELQKKYSFDLDIDSKHKELFDLAKDMIYGKSFRKDGMYYGGFCTEKVEREIAKRLKWTLNEVRDFIQGDAEKAFKGKLSRKEVQKREKKALLVSKNGEVKILYDKNVDKYLKTKKIEEAEIDKDIKEIKGQPACGGKVKGVVKQILEPKDMSKMQEGDILVATCTNPDIVPAMKKAGAIITDVGGITCHAAVVSREMNTPCIIGTNIGTKILKDGMEVEVDADNGVIKILDSSETEWICHWPVIFGMRLFHAQWIQTATNDKESYTGVCMKKAIFVMNKKISSVYLPVKENEISCKKNLEIIRNDKNFTEKLMELTLERGEEYLKFCEKLKYEDLTKKTDKQLLNIYKKQIKMNRYLYKLNWPVLAADFSNELLMNTAQTELRERIKDKAKEIEYHITLTTPEQESNAQLNEIDMLKIAKKSINPELIKKHTEKWCWLPYLYSGPTYTEEHFIKEIENLVKEGKIEEKLEKAKNRPEEIRKKKQEIIKELNLDEGTQHLYKTISDFIYLKMYRKDLASKAYYLLDNFITEFSKRIGVTKEQFYDMHEWEVEDAILNNKIDIEEITKRQEKYAMLIEDGKKIELNEEELQKHLSKVIKKGQHQKRNKIIGQVACVGKARGHVRKILRPEDMEKMNQGDVLVSQSTTPDILPAMKQASAIITNEGGITSHAAIVAREFDIPCIIGTEVAMELLEDGDLIDVDAENGIITLIEEEDIDFEVYEK